jgi:hypothetical protein
VQNALLAWANAELGAGRGGAGAGGDDGMPGSKLLTSTLAIPSNLPDLTAATPGVLRFPLNDFAAKVPGLKNAVFEVELQLINPTTYRMSKPKIVGNTAEVKVSGIHVYLRAAAGTGPGTEDARQSEPWISVSATAAAFAMPKTPPKGPYSATPLSSLSLAIPVPDPSTVMTIGFDSLE